MPLTKKEYREAFDRMSERNAQRFERIAEENQHWINLGKGVYYGSKGLWEVLKVGHVRIWEWML
jgi:hypothetical protein